MKLSANGPMAGCVVAVFGSFVLVIVFTLMLASMRLCWDVITCPHNIFSGPRHAEARP